MNAKEIGPGITIAGQPDGGELQGLREAGYVAVVNLRHEGEPEQPLGPLAEGEFVRGLGLDYHHLGVGGAPPTAAEVQALRDFLDTHTRGKVLVHCWKGGRAAALILIHLALSEGWAAEEAVARGRAIGLEVEGKLRNLVDAVLDESGRP